MFQTNRNVGTSCADHKVYLTDPEDFRDVTDNGSEDLIGNEFGGEESDDEGVMGTVTKKTMEERGKIENVSEHDTTARMKANTSREAPGNGETNASREDLEDLGATAKRVSFTEKI